MAGTEYHRNKEDKMNYTNCECKTENLIPCEGREAGHDKTMTESVQEIKGIAADIVVIANRVNAHMFGHNTPENGSDNKKEATCLTDDIGNIRSMLLETTKILNDMGYKIGC